MRTSTFRVKHVGLDHVIPRHRATPPVLRRSRGSAMTMMMLLRPVSSLYQHTAQQQQVLEDLRAPSPMTHRRVRVLQFASRKSPMMQMHTVCISREPQIALQHRKRLARGTVACSQWLRRLVASAALLQATLSDYRRQVAHLLRRLR